jgi:hypothetical protein
VLGDDLVELTLRSSADGGFEHARADGAQSLDEDFWLNAHAARVCPSTTAALNL